MRKRMRKNTISNSKQSERLCRIAENKVARESVTEGHTERTKFLLRPFSLMSLDCSFPSKEGKEQKTTRYAGASKRGLHQ
jgi:hypothetical protein